MSNDKSNEIHRLAKDHCKSPLASLVANVGDAEDNQKGQRCPYRRESIRGSAVEAKRPRASYQNELWFIELATYRMIDGVYVVRGDHVENTQNVET